MVRENCFIHLKLKTFSLLHSSLASGFIQATLSCGIVKFREKKNRSNVDISTALEVRKRYHAVRIVNVLSVKIQGKCKKNAEHVINGKNIRIKKNSITIVKAETLKEFVKIIRHQISNGRIP